MVGAFCFGEEPYGDPSGGPEEILSSEGNRIISKVQKSFCSCTHVNSCQKYALYINLHIVLNI